MKGKIIAIIGESSTGKSEIERRLVQKGYKKSISYTTREKRVGEKDGIDYHFIKNDEYEELDKHGYFLEKTSYYVSGEHWNYGFGVDSFGEDGDRVLVINPSGLRQLLEHEEIRDRLIVFRIKSSVGEIIKRYLGRESDGNTKFDPNLCVRLIQRLCADSDDFCDECLGFLGDFDNYFVINNNGMNKDDLDGVVESIEWYISLVKEGEEWDIVNVYGDFGK